MKKNKIFTLGLIAAFVAILSLTLVAGTFAKYTSTVTGNDSARVAKWGFTLNDENLDLTQNVELNLFDTILDTDGQAETDVKKGQTEKIIAPGTSGKFEFSVKNASEVNALFNMTLTFTNEKAIPLEFSFDNGTTWVKYSEAVTTGDVELNMDATDPTKVTVQWKWAFDGNDVTDTTLGVEGTAVVTVLATITFTQVD